MDPITVRHGKDTSSPNMQEPTPSSDLPMTHFHSSSVMTTEVLLSLQTPSSTPPLKPKMQTTSTLPMFPPQVPQKPSKQENTIGWKLIMLMVVVVVSSKSMCQVPIQTTRPPGKLMKSTKSTQPSPTKKKSEPSPSTMPSLGPLNSRSEDKIHRP